MSLFVVYVILCTDSTSWLMASADVLPRLQQRALQADEIISQLKAQLQQLNSSSAASCMFFSNIWQFVILSLKGLRPNSNSISLAGRKPGRKPRVYDQAFDQLDRVCDLLTTSSQLFVSKTWSKA